MSLFKKIVFKKLFTYLILSTLTIKLFAQNQQVALDPLGNCVMIWQMTEPVNSRNIIEAGTQPFEGSWSSITLSDASQESFNPVLAMNQGGDAVSIWSSLDPNTLKVSLQGSMKLMGNNWGPPAKISADGHNIDFQDYTVSININGKILASWKERDNNGNPIIFTSNATIGGNWSTPVTVNQG